MNQQHPYRAIIPPIPNDQNRPLWSVMIPTYNCANYLRETLTSVLAQDPGPEIMQIEVIDDHSTKDDPQAVVEELGKGRVGFYRQPQNVGHTKNFETCLTRSRGKLIHLLHGDDCVREGFYQKMQKGFETQPEIGAAFCRHSFIDEQSHWRSISSLEQPESEIFHNGLEKMAIEQRIQTPSIVVRREVYEALGGFDSRLSWSEDWEMWVRIAANYPIWYETEILAAYRIHSGSNTARYSHTGENLKDVRNAIEIIQSQLPPKIAQKTFKKSMELVALMYIQSVRKMLTKRCLTPAFTQCKEALNCSFSFNVINSLILLFILAGLKTIESPFLLRKTFS